MRGRTLILAALAVVALVGTGCARAPEGATTAANLRCPEGSDCYDPPRAIGEGGELAFTAVDFAYPEVRGAAWAGDIGITLENEANGEHNIVFVGANEGSDEPITAPGTETVSGTVNLFSGEYTYYCSIPGHRASGMEGVLTVYATQAQAEEAADGEIIEPGGEAAAEEDADLGGQGGDVDTEVATETSDGTLEDPDAVSEPGDEADADDGLDSDG